MKKRGNKKGVTYDLVEGDIDPVDLADVIKDLMDDPRCDGFDGLDAFPDESVN